MSKTRAATKSAARETKASKEYLTARVSEGFTDRFRASIPKGFAFGHALEKALELWMSLPEDYRLQILAGRVGSSLIDVVEEVVDRKIQEGIAAGKLLTQSQRQKPPQKGSAGSDAEDQGE